MHYNHQSIPDRLQPGLPMTASGVTQQGTSEEAAGSVERKMLSHKGGYLKHWNNDWKGKRIGRYDGAKECRHIVPTGNTVVRE